jgi:phosphoribosylformylglycinamidine cyclo-ligase
VVLGGSAVGVIRPKSRLLLGSRLAPGDAILIAPAAGIHANGLTLARSIAEKLPQGYATPVPGDGNGRSYGEVLLDPTPLYGPLVEALQSAAVELHYAAHITGHGFRKLMRASPQFTYVLEQVPEVNPIFRFLVSQANLSEEDSYGTFNMGAGYALYVPESEVERARSAAQSAGFELLHAGHVEAGPKRVVVRPLGLTFREDALQIR